MFKRVLWCVIFVSSIDSQFFNQKDDELCKVITKTNDTFVCTPINQCPEVLQASENYEQYPKICRFNGRIPIVCCRQEDDRQQNTAKKCKEYYSLTTKGGGTIDSGGCRPIKIPNLKKNALTIVGGNVAEENEFPHMVLLGFGEHIKNVEWSCGGSLISDTYVLSAAHCSEIRNKGKVRWALMGEHDLSLEEENTDPQIREIITRIVHPNYKPPSMYNDIGLYRLNTPVKFNRFIFPVCLNSERKLNTEQAVAIGWGRTDSAGPTSNVLMKVSLDLVKQDDCNQSYSSTIGKNLAVGINPVSQICAGEKEGGKDTCQGDSGGPLHIPHVEFECMYTQIGITSFGKLCGESNAPGVYTRISNYVGWINRIVWPSALSP